MDDNQIIVKVTKEELVANPPEIFKKFLLINSSMYTDEAFEYLLELVNKTDSVAFIQDTKKIFTHGEYFGGDLWEDSLFYFGNFQILNDQDELITEITAERQKEILRFKGLNNITITAEDVYTYEGKFKTINFGYDITNSIDTSVFKGDDLTAEYNLEIKDEKIHVNKYIPIRVEVEESTNVIEYDTLVDTLIVPINVIGTDKNKNIFVSSSTNDNVTVSEDYKTFTTNIANPLIDNINFLILYSDTKNQDNIIYTQKVGFGLVYGNEEITKNNFKDFQKYINYNNCDCEFILDLNDEEYGWFACPSDYKPVFIDRDSNIGGGWFEYDKFSYYSINLPYTVYRTEQCGLGHTKWIIKTKFD